MSSMPDAGSAHRSKEHTVRPRQQLLPDEHWITFSQFCIIIVINSTHQETRVSVTTHSLNQTNFILQ